MDRVGGVGQGTGGWGHTGGSRGSPALQGRGGLRPARTGGRRPLGASPAGGRHCSRLALGGGGREPLLTEALPPVVTGSLSNPTGMEKSTDLFFLTSHGAPLFSLTQIHGHAPEIKKTNLRKTTPTPTHTHTPAHRRRRCSRGTSDAQRAPVGERHAPAGKLAATGRRPAHPVVGLGRDMKIWTPELPCLVQAIEQLKSRKVIGTRQIQWKWWPLVPQIPFGNGGFKKNCWDADHPSPLTENILLFPYGRADSAKKKNILFGGRREQPCS